MAEAQNIISYVERRAKQVEDHPDWKPALEDILYMTHGSGSDRDRFYTVEEVGDLLLGGEGIDEIELRKPLDGGGYKKFHADGESVTLSQYGGTSPDNTMLNVGMQGFSIQKSTSDPSSTYTVEVGVDGVSVTETNPNGTFSADLNGGVLRLKRGNAGVEINYDKVVTPNLFLTFDANGRTSASADQYASMSDYESAGTGLPTEYFVQVLPGTQGSPGRDYYILDSASHNVGAVVILRNTSTDYAIEIYREDDSNREYPLCEIPPKSTKCFVYHGPVSTGSGTGVTHVWDVM